MSRPVGENYLLRVAISFIFAKKHREVYELNSYVICPPFDEQFNLKTVNFHGRYSLLLK